MIKKLLSILTLILSFMIFNHTITYASTIYSNNFTSSFDNFQEFFGHCAISPQGLSCIGSTNEQYTLTFPKIVCISADFNNPSTQSDSLSLLDGITTFAENFVAIRPSFNGHIAIDTANSSEGVATSSINTPSGKHNYMLCKDGNNFLGFLDKNLVVSYTESGHNPISFMLGSSGTGTITNLIVTDSLFTSPTPSTSPTPTPIPDSHLNVPLLKQTSNPWQSQIYDSAKSWAKSNFTINAWGCFITDAAMIFQYFGIQKMPDGSPLNPGTINTWLRSQKDGYVGNGYVNPLALQNLSKLIKLAFNNPSYTADALEYKLSNGANTNLVAQNLLINIPSILAEPGSTGIGHYVVATGKTGSIFTINDPFYNRTLLTDGYNNTFLFSQQYVPSHTDLSYILLVGPQNVDFTVKDASGSALGEEITQGPLQNPNDPSETNGAPIKMFFLEQPSDGPYTITATSNIPYAAKAYLYDQSGNVQIMDLKGSRTLANPDVFTLSFTKIDSHQDSIKKVSIFDQLTNDITQLYQQNQIKKGNSKDLLEEVNEAKNQYNKQHFLQEKVKLAELLIKLIVWDSNHTISHTAYQTLVGDITYLLTH